MLCPILSEGSALAAVQAAPPLAPRSPAGSRRLPRFCLVDASRAGVWLAAPCPCAGDRGQLHFTWGQPGTAGVHLVWKLGAAGHSLGLPSALSGVEAVLEGTKDLPLPVRSTPAASWPRALPEPCSCRLFPDTRPLSGWLPRCSLLLLGVCAVSSTTELGLQPGTTELGLLALARAGGRPAVKHPFKLKRLQLASRGPLHPAGP